MAATSTDPHFDHDPQQPQPQRGPDGSAVLWALYTQSEIITNLFLNWIPPHDFILGVEIMALNQNTLLMTSARTDLPLRYNMTSYVHFTVYLCSSRYPEALGRVNEQINKLNEGTDPKSLSRVCFSMSVHLSTRFMFAEVCFHFTERNIVSGPHPHTVIRQRPIV